MRFLYLSLLLVIGFTSTAQVDALLRMTNSTELSVTFSGEVSSGMKYLYTSDNRTINIKKVAFATFSSQPPRFVIGSFNRFGVKYTVSDIPLDKQPTVLLNTTASYSEDLEDRVYSFGTERMYSRAFQVFGIGMSLIGANTGNDTVLIGGIICGLGALVLDITAGRHLLKKRG